jgi:hypothetical protein
MRIFNLKTKIIIGFSLFVLAALIPSVSFALVPTPTNPQDNGIGLSGTISSPPPTQGATITSPASGAVFTSLPVTVTGFCPNTLLVKIFKNNVFSGSVMCSDNSYSIQIDLFSGQNDLIARVYDALDQAGPDSNKVTVTFNDNAATAGITDKVSLSSNYARRGSNPKEELTWPIIISGGTAPFAISVDWGDTTTADLYSVAIPGEFIIKHTYDQSGSYKVLVKGTDSKNTVAYLQLVAISNGQASSSAQNTGTGTTGGKSGSSIYWQVPAITIPIMLSTFWLGKRYERNQVKKRIERGEHPI